MTKEFISLIEILNQIGGELGNQISLAKNKLKIDTRKLSQQSDILNERIIGSQIPKEYKLMLHQFSSTLIQGNTTTRSLRYLKQDLERILSNLNDLKIILE